MEIEEVVDGMRAVLIEPFLDVDGFRMGDVVTVEISDILNLDTWKECLRISKTKSFPKGYDERIIVFVLDKKGNKHMCFLHRLTPAVNFQLELF